MNIDEIEGRELDVFVAEVMGFHDIHVLNKDSARDILISARYGYVYEGCLVGCLTSDLHLGAYRFVSHYSTSPLSAFQVMEYMQQKGWWPSLDWDGDDELWYVKFFSPSKEAVYRACALKVELAICRAALKVAEGDDEQKASS